MRAQFGLPSVRNRKLCPVFDSIYLQFFIAEEVERRAPISVKFEIPYFTVSGIQVRYLKIVEKSGYQALPWVRYVLRNTIILTMLIFTRIDISHNMVMTTGLWNNRPFSTLLTHYLACVRLLRKEALLLLYPCDSYRTVKISFFELPINFYFLLRYGSFFATIHVRVTKVTFRSELTAFQPIYPTLCGTD